MKFIISHDIDHLTTWEHWNDLILPKAMVRGKLEMLKGRISIREYFMRCSELFNNKMNYIGELIEFDKEHSVPSTFFMAVEKGLGLNYSAGKAKPYMKKILESGLELGVHGMCFDAEKGIRDEHKKFIDHAGNVPAGIRMHYMRMNEHTLRFLSDAGYAYDSSEYAVKNPYKAGNLWEFPVCLMDSYEVYNKPYLNLEQLKEQAVSRIREAEAAGINYFTVIFHDRYFTKRYSLFLEWYVWLIRWIREERLGRILEIKAGFNHSSDMDVQKPINWKRMVKFNGEYGCLGDLGMHPCHMPLKAGWKPRTVRARVSS